MSSDDEAVSREVAWRVFAREYDDADFAFKEGEDERAPNYVATPTGAKINRLFAVGVLTEVERVGDGDLLRARVSDPTGAFVVYAGQYQPEAVSFLADAETPSFVAVVGKARTYEPDDSDDVYTSIRPEEMNVVDAETRDRWNVETARETLRRVGATREYLRTGVTPEMRPPLHELGAVVDHYGTDEAYLNELEREASEVLSEIAGVEAAEVGAGAGTPTEATADETAEPAATESEDATAEEATEPAAEAGEVEEAEGVGDGEEAETTEAVEEETEKAETEATDDEFTDDFSDIEQEDIDVDEPEDAEEAEETEEFDEYGEPHEPEDAVEPDEEVGDWEWDEGQREEVEEEFGAEFETGAEFTEAEDVEADETEVEEEAEQESVEEVEDDAAVDETEVEEEAEQEAVEEEAEEVEEEVEEVEEEKVEPEKDGAETEESAETVVMNIIEEENGDEGVERSEIVGMATERGIDEDVAEATLEDLLLEGMCYPTDGDRIKPI